MDFVVNLPMDWNCTTVLTVVDYFLKICIFVPLSLTTAEHVARAFFQHVVAYHGLPQHIISDQDPQFTGKFWRALMKEMKTELHFGTTFYSQTDGLAEINNPTLEQLLQPHCSEGKWVDQLLMLALLYNAAPQHQTQLSPYFVATGRQPLLARDLVLYDLKVLATEDFPKDIKNLWSTIYQRATH